MGRRFLHVTPIRPALTGNGLAMRAGLFTEALAQLGDVDVLTIAQDPHAPATWAREGVRFTEISAMGRLDTRMRLIGLMRDPKARAAALREIGRPWASAILSAPVITEVREFVARTEWSGIVISRSYLLLLLDSLTANVGTSCPVIVDLDDDDASLLRDRAAMMPETEHATSSLLLAEADCYDAQIVAARERVQLFVAASAPVARMLGSRLDLSPLEVVPNGVLLPRPEDLARRGGANQRTRTILFVGNLSYVPNVDGICWFIKEVWPPLFATEPDLRLVVAGSRPAPAVLKACGAPGIELLRDPTDVLPLYASATVAIVPLRCGSGTRIKLLEAGAHGIPVVSTRKGAEGLYLDPSLHHYLAESTPQQFLSALRSFLSDPSDARLRAKALNAFVAKHYTRQRIVTQLTKQIGAVFSII